jgi:hypothetical protein
MNTQSRASGLLSLNGKIPRSFPSLNIKPPVGSMRVHRRRAQSSHGGNTIVELEKGRDTGSRVEGGPLCGQ